jgi:hypothetical protein
MDNHDLTRARLAEIDADYQRRKEEIELAPRPVECEGLAAQWCPKCGDCICPEDDTGERTLDRLDCPLHGAYSKHAEEPLPPDFTIAYAVRVAAIDAEFARRMRRARWVSLLVGVVVFVIVRAAFWLHGGK